MSNGHYTARSPGAGIDESQPQGSDEAGTSSDNMAEAVKRASSQARDKLMDTAEDQKRAGADYVTGLADAVRRAAGEFDDQVPQAGEYIRSAADQMQSMAESIRRRDLGQMLSDVQSFARRQPTAFLGASFFAGFAAIRFLRSSSRDASSSGRSWHGGEAMDDGRYGSSSAARMAPPDVHGEAGL